MEIDEVKNNLKALSVKELRRMIKKSKDYEMDFFKYVLAEYHRRVPYCEICGKKAPIFVKWSDMKICPSCNELMDDVDEKNRFFGDWDDE